MNSNFQSGKSGPRVLILLYAYKAYAKGEEVCDFVPTPVSIDESSYYGNCILGDCYVTIAKRWLEAGYVDAVKGVAITYPEHHPRHSPSGVARITDGFEFYFLDDISQYSAIHEATPSDVLWVRGEAPWEPIVEQHRASYKLYYNGSAVDRWRPRYPVDAVLVDDIANRIPGTKCVEFSKCCDEDVFRPLGLDKEFDVCFIARFDRNDKKGQLEFARLADKSWRAIFAGEVADADAVREVTRLWPSCEIAEHVTKSEVNEILNRSKVSIINPKAHDGCSRIIVESLAAGTPVAVNRRNIARKYVTRASGKVYRSLFLRRAVGSLIREWQEYDPRSAYEMCFHSRRVSRELWRRLNVECSE